MAFAVKILKRVRSAYLTEKGTKAFLGNASIVLAKAMIQQTFIIKNLKICSLNSAYATKDRKKSTETQKWLYALKVEMLKYRDRIKILQDNFARDKQFLVVDYVWFLPHKEYFRAKGGLNSRSGDWSNFPKIPDDMVFNTILGIDDGMISKGSVTKLPWNGNNHIIKITIKILDNDLLIKKSFQELPESLK